MKCYPISFLQAFIVATRLSLYLVPFCRGKEKEEEKGPCFLFSDVQETGKADFI